MLERLHHILRSQFTLVAFMATGFSLNSVLHIYRFQKVGWSSITGLFGQPQPIWLSFLFSLWPFVLIPLSSRVLNIVRRFRIVFLLAPIMLLLMNQACGRSILKLFFDILLVGIFYVSLLIVTGYGTFIQDHPKEKILQFVMSELMTIFQISLAILTFVIATFGFSFAPSYIDKYYHQQIGQPTVWWFGIMTLYLSLGVVFFVSMQAWILAVRLRSTL